MVKPITFDNFSDVLRVLRKGEEQGDGWKLEIKVFWFGDEQETPVPISDVTRKEIVKHIAEYIWRQLMWDDKEMFFGDLHIKWSVITVAKVK